MKNRFLLTALVVALAAAATAFARPTVSVPQDGDETQLEQYMEEINRGMRKLRRAVTDPEANAESIQDVRAMELLVIKSRNETPKMAADIAEDDRAEWLLEYQAGMLDFSAKLLELETALVHGDNESAAAAYKVLGELKSPAHKKFKAKD